MRIGSRPVPRKSSDERGREKVENCPRTVPRKSRERGREKVENAHDVPPQRREQCVLPISTLGRGLSELALAILAIMLGLFEHALLALSPGASTTL